jgi:glycosyltransferase involved in cell wall biosynthesis
MLVVKSVDGGTGKFVEDFQKISNFFDDFKVEIKTLILEEPSDKLLSNFDYRIYRERNHYPQRYTLTLNNFIEFFSELLWVKKNVDEFKPDVVLGIDMRPNFLSILSKMLSLNKFKVIMTTHIDLAGMIRREKDSKPNFFLKRAIHYFYNKADKLVCVSRSLSKSLKKDFNLNKKVETVYNGLTIHVSKPRTKPSNGKKIITMVARLVDQKDHDNLIMAFNMLQKKLPNIELWIIGDGPIRHKLESTVDNLKLTNKIIFWGRVPKIEKYLTKSDLFAFSSKREGFAYVLVEAMQEGLPVVSTDTPYGPREVLDNGKYGILVPMAEPVKMYKAMLSLLNNKKNYEYFSKKSIERSQYFSINKMLTGYKSLIEQIIE